MKSYVVSAPGKLMIAGEYAVLEGAEAVVAAVSRRAYARLGAFPQTELPLECAASFEAAQRLLGDVGGSLSIDVSKLRHGAKKLGLGSSAASAVAAAGCVFAAHGRDLASAAEREQLLQTALIGHRVVAPAGSGADVAAAALGGFVRFRKLGSGVETHQVCWPDELELVVVWSGQAVRTSDMIAGVQAFAAARPSVYRARMVELAAQSEQFVSALIAADTPEIMESFDGCGLAMAALGEAAGVPIVDKIGKQIQELARFYGGAAKPSGAGGGDVAIAAFTGAPTASAFRAGCTRAGFEVLSLELGAPGARYEEPK